MTNSDYVKESSDSHANDRFFLPHFPVVRQDKHRQYQSNHGNVVIFIEVHEEAITKQDGTFPLKAVVKPISSL